MFVCFVCGSRYTVSRQSGAGSHHDYCVKNTPFCSGFTYMIVDNIGGQVLTRHHKLLYFCREHTSLDPTAHQDRRLVKVLQE